MSWIVNLIRYSKHLSKETEAWALAFRIKDEKALYEGNAEGFSIIPNTARYWKADPFLISRNDKTWVFCEMYDRLRHKGVIGVAELKKNGCSRFKVCLELPQHLSFPYVYQDHDTIYMIPECCESGEVSVYRCVKFPTHWTKEYTIASIPGMDTIPVPDAGAPGFFLSSVDSNDRLVKFRQGDESYQVVYEHLPAVRCAGRIFRTSKGYVRPSQNDKGSYGNSLHFNLIDDLSFEDYCERTFLRVLPPESECGENEISLKVKSPGNIRFSGIHTYDHNEKYEIVDLVYNGVENPVVLWNRRKKLFEHIRKKAKRNPKV